MDRTTKGLLAGVIGVLGAVVFLALTVYPFHYGVRESLVVVSLLVAAALFETVLDDTSF